MEVKKPIKQSSTVYISNLSYGRDEKGLKFMFSKYGKVKNIKLIVDPKTFKSKGMAFVEMSSVAEAKRAIEGLNQQVLDGRTLKANFAIPMKGVANPFEKKFYTKEEKEKAPVVKKTIVKKEFTETRADRKTVNKKKITKRK
jgi:RNA recognition motif-containing protein